MIKEICDKCGQELLPVAEAAGYMDEGRNVVMPRRLDLTIKYFTKDGTPEIWNFVKEVSLCGECIKTVNPLSLVEADITKKIEEQNPVKAEPVDQAASLEV